MLAWTTQLISITKYNCYSGCNIFSLTEIKLSFSEPSYIVAEDAGVQTNLIAVVKEDNRTTEKTLEVMIQVLPYTDAKRGTSAMHVFYKHII